MIFTRDFIHAGENKYDRHQVEKIIRIASKPEIENIVIDGFSGIGGVTEGFERLENYMVIACINHWDVAIETHAKNHPDCLHLQEDFRSADLTILLFMINKIRRSNPHAKFHLWLSLECTNFSNAKGGMPRDADSRTLADHADRYVLELDPDVIWIENVKEFKLWGPMIPKVHTFEKGKKKTVIFPNFTLNDNFAQFDFWTDLIAAGKFPYCPLALDKKQKKRLPWMIPCPHTKGTDYERWKKHICSFGYHVDVKILNCADYGVPQHRVRLIMQFNRKDVASIWPEKTRDKKGANGLPKWEPVKPCLNLEKEGESVLAFKVDKNGNFKIGKNGKFIPRITSDATIDRLIKGCEKHVLSNGERSWIVKYNSANFKNGELEQNAGIALNDPIHTVPCRNSYGLAKIHLLDHYFGNGYVKSAEEPVGVSGTKDGISLHSVQFLSTYHSTGDGSNIDSAAPAIMTKDKYPLVSAHFLDMQYTSGQRNKSVNEPSGALLNVPKQRLVEVDRFVMDTQYNNVGYSLDETAKTITANRKHFYLVNLQWFNESFRNLDNPANTLIARMDKSPNYLVTLETGELAIEVYDYDPPHYVRLKKFMAEHGIVSINMRMLEDVELLKIMTLPADTKLSKSSTDNKKMIGNAVPSDLVEHLGKAWSGSRKSEAAAA
ncbi:MAG: DNA cytosine methyltransferase [Bacteroidetes bacterium]|nr:DNA cytosine methyltransferase [Bacteroidota bacterium]